MTRRRFFPIGLSPTALLYLARAKGINNNPPPAPEPPRESRQVRRARERREAKQ